jgi:biotin transport system substrate-specific component
MQTTTSYSPLLKTLFPQRTAFQPVLLVLLGSLFLGLLAQVSIILPFTPVPITGQTLGVALIGASLGRKLGFLTVITYLVEGVAGLPVFSAGGFGLAKLLGPTGGYLVAFPFAAALIGFLVEKYGADRKFFPTLFSMLAGDLITFTLGATWLAVWLAIGGKFPGIFGVLMMGVIPFLPGSLIKASLAAGLLPTTWKLIGNNDRVDTPTSKKRGIL